MPQVLWGGKLTFGPKIMMNLNNIWAWITGDARDPQRMKERMKQGYEGEISEYISRYDELAGDHYLRCAQELMEGFNVSGMEVLELACGTGIISETILEQGVKSLVCGDIADNMLNQCRRKLQSKGYGPDVVDFTRLDAEELPFDDSVFDALVAGMMFAGMPNQMGALIEMFRVLKAGGILAISAHGPDHNWEAIDAGFKKPSLDFLGYRMEWWPVTEKKIRRMMNKAGFENIQTRRASSKEYFESPSAAFEFAAAQTGLWMQSFVAPEKRPELTKTLRATFESLEIKENTTDLVLAYGQKPD